MLKEFRTFIMRGNVIDLAIGVVLGTAFGSIVSSLVADIIMPPIGMLLGGVDFSSLVITLQKATENSDAITINYGVFLNTVIDFVIIAFVIFIIIKQANKLTKPREEKTSPEEDTLLLREIRDLLKRR